MPDGEAAGYESTGDAGYVGTAVAGRTAPLAASAEGARRRGSRREVVVAGTEGINGLFGGAETAASDWPAGVAAADGGGIGRAS